MLKNSNQSKTTPKSQKIVLFATMAFILFLTMLGGVEFPIIAFSGLLFGLISALLIGLNGHSRVKKNIPSKIYTDRTVLRMQRLTVIIFLPVLIWLMYYMPKQFNLKDYAGALAVASFLVGFMSVLVVAELRRNKSKKYKKK